MATVSDLFADPFEGEKPSGTWRCVCNWFARFVSERHYFNGEWDMYSYTVDCKRCGIVTVECV